MSLKKYIIYTPLYNDNIGGIIVLYKLCQSLRRLGVDAMIWPMQKPRFGHGSVFVFLKRLTRYIASRVRNMRRPGPGYFVPIAGYKDLKDAIVVYPEIVNGNPLLASKIVRWFLHKPGFHTGTVNYGSNELYFFYNEAFNDESINPVKDSKLSILDLKREIYKITNSGKRSGTCYMIRKGRDRPLIHDLHDSIKVDGMSHESLARIFNEREFFYCYDLYTLYSVYAAMCGCKSIVVPMDGLSAQQWRPDERDRYGIAYGLDDLDYAAKTRQKMLQFLDELETSSERSVTHFMERCDKFFS